MKIKLYSLFIALTLVVVSSCDMDLQEDPNAVRPDTASLNLVLNRIQIDFADFFNLTSNNGMRLTRMISQPTNLYEQSYIPVNFNTIWVRAYSDILNDIKFLEPLAEEGNLRRHLGIARVIKAYTLLTMVDYFNAIPYSQALDPTNFNPSYDDPAAIYADALRILGQAREDFAAETVNPNIVAQDLYYNGTWANWIRVINSLELKYHLNMKLLNAAGSATAINALMATNDFIQPGQEFVFRYGNNLTDPDARHPKFQIHYTPAGAQTDYHSTWYMWHLTEAKGFDDPRARYYLYRQVTANPTDPDQLRCISEIAPGHYLAGGWPFCLPGTRGYWGRDHLNAEGIPPDGQRRTAWGLYPAGGRFDNNAGAAVSPTAGAGGAGIQPIMLPAFVDFMLAEAILTITGVEGNAQEKLEAGITKSMNYVRAFSMSTNQAGVIEAFQAQAEFTTSVTNYVNFVNTEWNGANADRRMNLIGREYWLSLFGNGNESYNLHRRTGKPDNMQPGLLANFGDFPRSFFLPNNHMVTNTNAQQKDSQRQRVFWDTNPEGNSWVY